MATPLSSSTASSTILENLVKYAICFDFYDDTRLLPCSHTSCYKCIEKLCQDAEAVIECFNSSLSLKTKYDHCC
ncbi:unnamed protein product [Adineta steineri]|uniref:Zinc finger C3HC4 RING-type domain-containing protein n=1 Tax=Adineta steineri TaxID=433720 RepID=A0A819LWM6_9BILA|nr:unnamed protein product [Adineta steineri]